VRGRGHTQGVKPDPAGPVGATAPAAPRSLDDRLAALASALGASAAADTVVVRLLDPAAERLVARGVFSSSIALAAEIEGSSIDVPAALVEASKADELPAAVLQLAERACADAALVVPVRAGADAVGAIELYRAGPAFTDTERGLARVAASQTSLLAGGGPAGEGRSPGGAALEAVGDALVGAAEGARLGHAMVRLAARAVGARAGVLWELGGNGAAPCATASFGFGRDIPFADVAPSPPTEPVAVAEPGPAAPERTAAVVTLDLGDEPTTVLQLFLPGAPTPATRDALAAFAGRAAQALRASRRSERTAAELGRTRALLAVVGQAIAELSLSHTLDTAVARVADLLGTDRVAVYLREGGGVLQAAGPRRAAGPDEEVASALLDLALGPLRGRGALVVEDVAHEPGLARLGPVLADAGVEAAVAAPLVVLDDAIGLLVAYLPRGRMPSDDEIALLTALAGQLGVAVQNARLHEEAKRLGSERARALASERQAARRLRAFYEVSQSFTRTMSLEETLEAVARTAVELVDADAAVIRTHDRRRGCFVPRAVYVAEEGLATVVETMLARPHSLDTEAGRALLESPQATLLSPALARELGEAYELLAPFLERGATAAVVPVASAGELIATLTVVSLDPERSIGEQALDAAASLATHAALAVDNARLYEQQRHFLEAMQQALLPQTLPEIPGLELAQAYESSARLEVGGDVYDFLALGDDRLAVVLGDVTGHGVDAAADMAMAKYIFRSLAREHTDPADFLASANDVVVGEIALGKLITMVYVAVDGRSGELRCASAGHPPPRLVRSGRIDELAAGGVALGIDAGQRYDEVAVELAPGDAVVLYTDGVIEARRDQELYGVVRLDAVLAANAGASAEQLAAAVLADCRAYAGGELVDDCAVVVVKRV
jgi:sigma-B regulation protein RsbU (phosphoserine phosphatase)